MLYEVGEGIDLEIDIQKLSYQSWKDPTFDAVYWMQMAERHGYEIQFSSMVMLPYESLADAIHLGRAIRSASQREARKADRGFGKDIKNAKRCQSCNRTFFPRFGERGHASLFCGPECRNHARANTYEVGGIAMTTKEIAEKFGINERTLKYRITYMGLSVKEAIAHRKGEKNA